MPGQYRKGATCCVAYKVIAWAPWLACCQRIVNTVIETNYLDGWCGFSYTSEVFQTGLILEVLWLLPSNFGGRRDRVLVGLTSLLRSVK